jgi:hypothetical protein
MTSFTINSKQAVESFQEFIQEEFIKEKYLIAKIVKATRLQIQNRWIQQFYNMVSGQTGQPRQTLVNHCKYYHGMPILLVDQPEQAELWRKMMIPLTEQERLAAMEITAVTSLMDVHECSDYIKQLIAHFDHCELPRKQWRE